MKNKGDIEGLIKVLNDKKWITRWEAVKALFELNDPAVVEPLIDTLKNDENQQVRKEIIQGFGLIKDPRVIDPLIIALKDDEDRLVREAAARILGIIKDPRTIEPLKKALLDESESVQFVAKLALSKFGISSSFSNLKSKSKVIEKETLQTVDQEQEFCFFCSAFVAKGQIKRYLENPVGVEGVHCVYCGSVLTPKFFKTAEKLSKLKEIEEERILLSHELQVPDYIFRKFSSYSTERVLKVIGNAVDGLIFKKLGKSKIKNPEALLSTNEKRIIFLYTVKESDHEMIVSTLNRCYKEVLNLLNEVNDLEF